MRGAHAASKPYGNKDRSAVAKATVSSFCSQQHLVHIGHEPMAGNSCQAKARDLGRRVGRGLR